MSDVKDDSDDPEDDYEPSPMVFPSHYDRAEDYYRDKLLVDVNRVKKLLDLNAPDQVLAGALFILARTAIGLGGGAFTKALGERLAQGILKSAGFCNQCRQRLDRDSGDCPRCDSEEDDEAEGPASDQGNGQI
jgi:hypothetical protein